MKNNIRFLIFAILTLGLMVQNSKAQDDIMFRKYVVYSGINGLFYGLAFDAMTDINGGAAAGIPVITAGVSVLVPLISNSSKTMTPNSMVLSTHGKFIGWVHGFALSTLLAGDNAWSDNTYKLTIGLGAVTSIGMGVLGKSVGRNTNWTEGQVALYRHYGWLGPLTGVSLAAAFSDEPRLMGASTLLFGAGGYFFADKVYRWNEYTKGDIRATQVLSLLNGGLGFGIIMDISENGDLPRANILIPAVGALSGTLIGHLWTKNTKLTPRQGLQSAYAATGGAVIGFGIALVTESNSITPYYLIPYITGMGAYAIAVERMRKVNQVQSFIPRERKNNWQVAFMPQNLFLNSKIPAKGYMVNGKIIGMQPLFAASVTF
jgi:hypothetical protein